MLQRLVQALNNAKGSKFVAFTYTNKFGEEASRLIQINTIYENALKKDLEIIPNVEYVENERFDRATFITAQAELMKSAKMSLGINDDTMNKTDASDIAFAIQAGAPMVPPSPSPRNPPTVPGSSASTRTTSIDGISTAEGTT